MKKIVLFLISLYQKYISPNMRPHCRYYPTCSEYARQAFTKYNFFKGLYLSIKRILKCNPFSNGGYDPLP
ncbi:MAG: membrane protein insertion efficiency factor YidD [Anaerofustis stercorihominis]|nr:membrane protein insertion efficiency factor YidD [Anaerofustis stercorihominis]